MKQNNKTIDSNDKDAIIKAKYEDIKTKMENEY